MKFIGWAFLYLVSLLASSLGLVLLYRLLGITPTETAYITSMLALTIAVSTITIINVIVSSFNQSDNEKAQDKS